MKDLKDVLSMVKDAAAIWDDIALALEIRSCEIEVIESNHRSDCKKQLKEILKLWLKGMGGQSSWKFLCDAMKSDLVDRTDLADAIERKYI